MKEFRDKLPCRFHFQSALRRFPLVFAKHLGGLETFCLRANIMPNCNEVKSGQATGDMVVRKGAPCLYFEQCAVVIRKCREGD